MGPRAGLDGRKISSPPGFDPGPSSPWSVAIPTELPGPQHNGIILRYNIVGPPSHIRSVVDRRRYSAHDCTYTGTHDNAPGAVTTLALPRVVN